jgi:hypothetical protein
MAKISELKGGDEKIEFNSDAFAEDAVLKRLLATPPQPKPKPQPEANPKKRGRPIKEKDA